MAIQHQYSLTLIPHQVKNAVVDQRASDGYINATALCKAAEARWSDYNENKATKAFVTVVSAKTGIPVLDLIQIVTTTGVKATWVHPKIAINLGQWLSPEFAYQVAEWVEDWMSGKATNVKAAVLPAHLDRYLRNDNKVPPGYFSILQETALGLFGPLHMLGFDIPKGWVPDISVGRMFCKHLREKYNIDTDALPVYWHDYLDGRPLVEAKLYPEDLLAIYRSWFRETWLPINGVAYFGKKDKNSLAFLDKMPALAAPKKPASKPLPSHAPA